MPALRYSEDTEFNDALRARGILPPLATEEESESEDGPGPAEGGGGMEELIGSLEDRKQIEALEIDENDPHIPAGLLDSWKSARLAQLRHAELTAHAHSSGLKPIGKQDYLREVNQASEIDVDPSSPLARKGTGVVLCLWNDSASSRHILDLLDRLSSEYPTTRFLSMRGSACIEGYPEENQPTLICYRAGSCVRQYVGIGANAKMKATLGKLGAGLAATLADLESELAAIGILDLHLKKTHPSHLDSDDDDDLDGPNGQKNLRSSAKHDSDSELDI